MNRLPSEELEPKEAHMCKRELFQQRTLRLLCALFLGVIATQASAAIIVYTEGVPNGLATIGLTASATGSGYGFPTFETFDGFATNTVINFAQTGVNLSGTALGGGTFQIGSSLAGDSAKIKASFANSAPANHYIPLDLEVAGGVVYSFLATGRAWNNLGFSISRFFSDTNLDDELKFSFFTNINDINPFSSVTVDFDSNDADGISATESAFVGFNADVPFRRIDIIVADSQNVPGVGFDNIRIGFVPEPASAGMWGLLGTCAIGGASWRRPRRNAAQS